MNRLFCYGTLQFPEVIQTVTGRTYTGKSATLDGYAGYKVRNAEYPGLIRDAGSKTKGVLYENISEKDLKVLDLFEGNFYTRQLLDVVCLDGSETKAWVYVIAEHHRDILTDECWELQDFLDHGFASFMKGYVLGRRNFYSS
ncbi:hypothetical protein D1AOALGA4SA_7804 [Olavius algarvensis Delta 1 endosymbiont]|nr:hypothetical protein D1AOALGA4SA_7804 [Olavius algarvensis Delta 1 endosymbiont]